MICRQCGRYMPDNSRFCPGCGTTVQAAPQYPTNPQQPVYQTNPQQPVYQANPQQPVYQANPQQPVYQAPAQQNPAPQPLDLPDSPRLVALKKLAGSPMMLIATIACTLGVLGGALVSIFMIDLINELSTFWVSIGEEVVTFDMSSVAGAIAGVIPSALICLGLWITYGSARKEKGMSTAGLVIIKVLNIIALVGMCVSTGIFLLGFGMGTIAAYMENPESAALTALIVVGVIFVAIFAFAIILQARTIGSLNAAIGIINNGRTAKKVSVFLAVILIMGAVGNALSGLGLMSISGMLPEIERLLQQVPQLEIPAGTLSGLNETVLVLGIPYLISAVSGFMFALLIFSYKANVQNLIVAPTPVEAREIYPYAPAPAPVVKETPAEEPAAEEAPAEEPAAEEAPAEEPAVEEAPAEEPAVEVPVVEVPAPAFVAEEVPAFIFCTECGQKLVGTAKFCSRCGHPQK